MLSRHKQLSSLEKFKRKNTYQRKEDKAEGRRTRLRGSPSSTSSNIVKCKSCGNFGHATAASKACKNHIKNQDGILQEKLGNNFQRYTRKIKFETVLRDEYKTKFTEKIVTLSAFLKEVIIKAQFFEANASQIYQFIYQYCWNMLQHTATELPEFCNDYKDQVESVIKSLKERLPLTPTTVNLSKVPENFIPAFGFICQETEEEADNAQEQNYFTAFEMFNTVFAFGKFGYKDLSDWVNAGENGKHMFTCFMQTDGHGLSLQFARKKDQYTEGSKLKIEDFNKSEIEEYFLHCKIDLGRIQIFTASIGLSSNVHHIRRCSDLERRCYTGVRRRQAYVEKLKILHNVKELETNNPTSKTT
ncbi:hypothetical protein MFLAVUS_004380 [Mucor flavus]|uniref:Uncharacterized protein n=1 Tax=Mucor flavus TaxID=439312 RepID=A0ABP9YVT1_9FUNG